MPHSDADLLLQTGFGETDSGGGIDPWETGVDADDDTASRQLCAATVRHACSED